MERGYEGTTFYASLIGTTPDIVAYWCRKGLIDADRNGKRGKYMISMKSFSDFLYVNPKYLKRLEAFSGSPYKNRIRDILLEEISVKGPKFYTIKEFCQMFEMSEEGIKHWVRAKGLGCYRPKRSIDQYLFTMEDFKAFIKRNPYYRSYYIDYIGRRELETVGT